MSDLTTDIDAAIATYTKKKQEGTATNGDILRIAKIALAIANEEDADLTALQTQLNAINPSPNNLLSTILTRTPANLAAAGANQGNAALIVNDFTNVTGADGTKGVILPAVSSGRLIVLSNSDNTNTLKVYPPTGGKINRGTANAAIIVQPNTTFIVFGDMEAATDWSTVGYTSYATGGTDGAAGVTANAQVVVITITNTFLDALGVYTFNLTNSAILSTSTLEFGIKCDQFLAGVQAMQGNTIDGVSTLSVYNLHPTEPITVDIIVTVRVINKGVIN